MTPSSQRAAHLQPDVEEAGPPQPMGPVDTRESDFDEMRWREAGVESEFRGAGGRQVLAIALAVLAALWIGYSAWAAGRALGGETLSSPALAQWVALAAGPLALLGLVWIMFGRTRRKEAERFTRSVVAMRTEARSLEGLLQVLSQRIGDSRAELTMIAQHLMQLGDETSGRFSAITRDLDDSSERIVRHGAALDRAAEAARTDIGVLLDDLPRAEAIANAMREQLRAAGSEAGQRAGELERQVESLTARSREAQDQVAEASQRLVTHLTHIESAGAAAAARVGEADGALSGTVDALLSRSAVALDQIRAGIDSHSAAVSALVAQASAGLERAGGDSAETLAAGIAQANRALDGLSERLGHQEQASRRITEDTTRTLGELDRHFADFAERGDARAAAFAAAIGTAREALASLDMAASAQDATVDGLTGRTAALQATIGQLTEEVREQLATAVADTESGTARMLQSAQAARPEISWMRDAAVEASERIAASSTGLAEQQDRFAALLATIDDGVGNAEERLGLLAGSIASARSEAERLSQETGPALVAAMVQVREAASHAADRAREAIASVVPDSAEKLSVATREALERAIREGIEDRLREVETTAARAVETARAASDRLTGQMLTLGQSATALEQHIERNNAAQREKDSEAFARRVSMLIDSMNSAAIDVGKILSDEVDEKAWESYLKGNRGVFTRRAVRLLDGDQAKAIRAHYDSDSEFQQSVNRYVHDFESMLRRVLAERDGGMIAVTLMSSDMGKLYAALGEAVDRRR